MRPRGRTRQINHDKLEAIKVSIHASSREDATFLFMASPFLSVFQSTHPHGRTRQMRTHNGRESIGFNPRVLAGGRDLRRRHTRHTYRFQSTRPRGRTRLSWYDGLCDQQVSIHASSREDATQSSQTYRAHRCFNPRVLAGGRDRYFHLLCLV